ncbi:pyridoxal phosphate-dependent aminotransferase [Desulfonema ishimotonii]|uniref:Pyridoxal phosphate-dependent aminotransferase n=1 Tax=Desulfonema ishimotonii TaxID=45657 RepID=A0A401FWW7_9BACT|nr:aminotransferase class I/II-fold pyridoxal phosphate-dependent enzyme [Desulfonema ishimotonii]GBC61424.1 pyridoxal phosphate-dependent aminotransferase [Desulfonema ishimotonii]
MTGFRLGYAAAPKEIIREMAKHQSHATGNVCTFAQHGALAALTSDPGVTARWRAELEKKRDMAFAYASRLFDCVRPQGAFYLFPDVSGQLKTGETAEKLAACLLEETGVATVPGEAFGMENHLRISYAVPEPLLISGFEKISETLKRRR